MECFFHSQALHCDDVKEVDDFVVANRTLKTGDEETNFSVKIPNDFEFKSSQPQGCLKIKDEDKVESTPEDASGSSINESQSSSFDNAFPSQKFDQRSSGYNLIDISFDNSSVVGGNGPANKKLITFAKSERNPVKSVVRDGSGDHLGKLFHKKIDKSRKLNPFRYV